MRIAAQGGPVVRLAFGDRSDESRRKARQASTELGSIRVHAANQVVLLVRHGPWAGRRAVIPATGIAVVRGLHGAVAVIAAIDLGVAVIEAATGIEVQAVDHPILPLRLVVDRGAFRVVYSQSHSWFDEDAVGLVAH